MAGPAGIGTESVYGSDVSTSEPPTFPDAIGRDYGLGDDGLTRLRAGTRAVLSRSRVGGRAR